MSLHETVRDLLRRLPGGDKDKLQAARFLKESQEFFRVVRKSKSETERDAAQLAKHLNLPFGRARKLTLESKVEAVRPDWLGPDPGKRLALLSELPKEFDDSFEFADGNGLVEVYWGTGAADDIPATDALLLVSDKGRAWLVDEAPTERGPRANGNDPRDEYIVTAIKAGKTLEQIKLVINQNEAWEPLHTPQAVSQAAKRYKARQAKRRACRQKRGRSTS